MFSALRIVSSFRDKVRLLASNFKSNSASEESSCALSSELLKLCDQLRDGDLFDLGVVLEDRDPPLPALIKMVDKDTLRQMKHEKAQVIVYHMTKN